MGNNLLAHDLLSSIKNNNVSHIITQNSTQWLDPQTQQSFQSQWTNVTEENIYYLPQYGKFTLYRNQQSLEQVEKYKLILKDREEFNKFTNLLKWRNNCHFLPKIEHFIIENKTQICVSQFQINIFTQRIPLRLSDLTDIPFPENLYFMAAILKGYKYIFGSGFSVKMFKATQSMVGVNRDGQVKVWWSQNLSSLQLVDSKQVFISEQDFIKGVIEIVEENTDHREYPFPFKKYLSDRNIILNGDFNHVISQIYNYAKQMKVIIPKYAFSVREILTRDMFQNTKIYTQNSFSNHDFKQPSKMIRQQQEKQAQQNFVKNHPIVGSDESMFGQFNRTNDMFNRTVTQRNFKNNSGLVQDNLRNPSNERVNPYLNEYVRSSENKINQGGYQMVNNGIPYPPEQLNPSQHVSYSFNKIGKNIVQFTNNMHEPYNHHMSYVEQKHPNVITNHMIVNSNPIKFNINKTHVNDQNYNQLRIPQQQFSSIATHYNQTSHLSSYPSQNLHHNQSFSPFINTQSIQRNHSYHVPFAYQNQSNPNISHLPHQNSTPIFPQYQNPKQMTTKVQFQRINKIPTLVSQNSQNKQNSHSEKPFSQQTNKNNTNSINNDSDSDNQNKLHKNNPQSIKKLKYFTKKDSQQTLDPQIANDLAKYLNQP